MRGTIIVVSRSSSGFFSRYNIHPFILYYCGRLLVGRLLLFIYDNCVLCVFRGVLWWMRIPITVDLSDYNRLIVFQYTMSKEWFWDPAGTFQTNHRLIFIGLHNTRGVYKWTDDSRLGYG